MRSRFVRSLITFLDRFGSEENDTPQHLATGRKGERDAHFFLREAGYVVVGRNWRVPERKGEIDLIAWDGEVLCFVEVKTRTTREVKPAEAAVDGDKQRELRGMARAYLRRLVRRRNRGSMKDSRSANPAVRFDIVSVYYDGNRDEATEIHLFRNAFPMA